MVSNWEPAHSLVEDAISGAEIAPRLPGLAVPQFGLLSYLSSLRLSSGHSGPVLTLSNAAHASPFSSHLLVDHARVWATSMLGVVVRHVICGFYFFIYFPPGYVAL